MNKIAQYAFILVGAFFINHAALANTHDYKSTPAEETVTPKSFTQSADNKINGSLPPGKIGVSSRQMLLNQNINGMTHMVMKVTRRPGYRSPVHYHNYSPVTCVLTGETTFFLEGYKPRVITSGHCFSMPANIKGFNYNSGKTTMSLMDFMVLPKGTPTWVLLEDAPNYSENDM